MKVATVSDLHLGCHCDGENWHNIILQWGEWFRDQLVDHDISRIILCGDFFDNRNEIGVKTISVAGRLMDLWSDFEITMITGNHDMFYRDRTDVSSISIFEGRKNVTIVADMTTDVIAGKDITYIPWGQDINKLQQCDIVFGHLEIDGFKMMVGKLAEGRTSPKALTSKAKLIFTGHFHLRDERKYASSDIIYIGSPYQINRGEASNMPGYYIIDIENMSYEFYENTISPKHVKMTSESMKYENIAGNIVDVEIDGSIENDVIELLKTKVYDKNPLEVNFNVRMDGYTVDDDNPSQFNSHVDVSTVLLEYVNALKLEQFTDDVKDKLSELFTRYCK